MDATVEPWLGHFHLLNFLRAKEAIKEGRRAVERVADTLALLRTQAP